jgi:hypothetical protein
MGQWGFLSRYSDVPGSESGQGFRMEIVRFLFFLLGLVFSKPISSYVRTYHPDSYHIAQELQKYNIPDYRPRQEQYVVQLHILPRDPDLMKP